MTLGTHLKDQIPSILNYVGDGIQSLMQFRSFIKDRASIERDYAQKLENLSKKYKGNVNNKKSATANELNDEWDWEDNSSTTSAAWCNMVNHTALVSKTRFKLVDDLNNIVVDSLRGVATRKEDARKKHASFYQKLKNERDKTYAEKDKAKQLYDDACAEIENLKMKLSKSTGDQDKIQRQLDNAIIDRDNKKNLYLLAIEVANAERTKYFEEDLPMLADHLEELDQSRVMALKYILRRSVEIDSGHLKTIQKYDDDMLTCIEKIDHASDTAVFIRASLEAPDMSEKSANVMFKFLPWNGGVNAAETIIDRDGTLVSNDLAVIYLNNKLIKDRKSLDSIADDLSQRSTEMHKMESLLKSAGYKISLEYDKSKERVMEVMRDITLLSTQKVRIKSEVDLIIKTIGDEGLRAKNHDFKTSSFTIPTTCDYCNSTMWGISNKGFTCKSCGFNCHAKCEMKVAPNCSKKKGQINPQPIITTSSHSSFHSERKSQPDIHNDSSRSISLHSEAAYSSQTPISGIQKQQAKAIYTYDAQREDELTIEEGETVDILEADDGSGWVKAQVGNEIGLVPANYVKINDGTEPLEHSANQAEYSQPVPDEPVGVTPLDNTGFMADYSTSPSTPQYETVIALYDFEAVNAEELNIRQGDRITVINKDNSGWWEGSVNGHTGIFPANYVGPE
ncbi:hypothetical protein BDB01DRAFT_845530 [Pilobolus umbonatus]|nr:hypothetical protein BDB01DRAFT_845530 [Pilobolus umbonatus]